MLYSAKLYDGAAHGEKYGISSTGLAIDHSKVIARKNKVVKTLVSGVKAALKSNNVTLVEAEAEITGKPARAIQSVQTAQFIPVRGSLLQPALHLPYRLFPLSEGIESGFVMTNREALSITEPPEKLVVIGGGVIGLEMASYYNSIGADVTVIEMLDHIGGENDIDLIKILQRNYEKRV